MKNETKNLIISLTALFAIITLCACAVILLIKYPTRTRIVQVKAVGKSCLLDPEEYYIYDKNENVMQISFEDFEEIYNAFVEGYLVYISYDDDIWDNAFEIGYEDKIYDIEIYLNLKENE